MAFEVEGTVALISGGASGIGLRYAKELLKNGLKGVTLADIDGNAGHKALQEIEDEFGANKAIFVKTDVTNFENYEEAFKQTVATFKNLDIVINNAGILDDSVWQKEITLNINGVLHGVLLGLENYIPKYKTRSEGVIVNISSIAGLEPFAVLPVYVATKFAVLGMSLAFGNEAHFARSNVRVLTLCPGITDTPLMAGMKCKGLLPWYNKVLEEGQEYFQYQTPESVAEALVKIIKSAKTGTAWVAEGGKDPYEFIMPNRESFAPQ